MSNVKALTRDRAKLYSHHSESSIESISDLAIKIGKINRFEDVKGRYDASGDDIKIKSLSKSNEATDSAMLNSTSSATTNSERVQHKPTLLDYFNVEISNRYGILSDVEMRDLESDLGNSSQVNDTAATRPVETEQLEGEALKKTPKPPPICFVSRVKQNYREFRAKLDSVAHDYYQMFTGDKTMIYYRNINDYVFH
ncbi:hypothetical protein QE152_g33649 [Popillia japonica]|uniref:Uncharacterized protein n=1 Tax=Popillia japonica TaxID=7064 RepID=A0AAW1IW70_POPJA